MNERCSGAIEALSWVLNLLERAAVKKLDLASIVAEGCGGGFRATSIEALFPLLFLPELQHPS